MHHEHPELVRDQYWDEMFPVELPYTVASEPFRESHPEPSTANIAVTNNEAEIALPPQSIKIDDFQSVNDMNSGPIIFTARKRDSETTLSGKKRGSQTSLGTSITDSSLPRNNSVTNVLKRLFSKEDHKEGKPPSQNSSSIELNQMNTGLVPKIPHLPKRITDEIIEEVDEQMSHNSHLHNQVERPSVIGMFGPPPPSKPISVPTSPTER